MYSSCEEPVACAYANYRRDVTQRHQPAVATAAPTEELDDCAGHSLRWVVVGVTGQVLHLDVDEHPCASLERLLERGDLGTCGPDLGLGSLREHTDAAGVGVVVDDQRTVGAAVDVELDPVGSEGAGSYERFHRGFD